MHPLFGLLNISPVEMMILAILGVLLFGRRLPEVGRYLGKGIVEFKKGLHGLEEEVGGNATALRSEPPALDQPRPPQRVPTTAPKFEENAGAITNTPPKA